MSAALVPRLLTAADAVDALARTRVEVIGPAAGDDDAVRTIERIRRNPTSASGWLVFGWIGTHPDAAAPVLRQSWRLEEACRASGLSTLVLRLAPLVGPRSPLWLKLARAGAGRLAGRPLQPVLERDVVTLIRRILEGTGPPEGWYEISGPGIMTLGELSACARRQELTGAGPGFWEPEPAVLREQPLVEPEIWMRAFAVDAGSVAPAAREWAA